MSKKSKNTAASASPAVQPTKKRLDSKEVVKIAAILTAICVVITALLAGTNLLTAQKIAANAVEAKAQACHEVLPADEYIKLDCEHDVYLAVSGSNVLGAVITTSDKGYGGQIEIMVGIALDGSVTGVNMLEHSETPGLGANSAKPEFLRQYVTNVSEGDVRPDEFAVTKDGGQIDAVTAATISSRAVTRAVNAACDIFDELYAAGLLVLDPMGASVSTADIQATPASGTDAVTTTTTTATAGGEQLG